MTRSASLLAMSLSVAAACTTAPAAKPASNDAMLESGANFGGTGEAKPLLTLGMTRPIGEEAATFSAEQLNAYLSAQLGGPVVTRLYADAADLGDALSIGQVDAAWLTPIAYVRAKERAAVEPVARLSRGGFASYRSVVFTRADSKVSSLEDLKGRRMAWVGPGSASGRAFPRAHLKRIGKIPDTFFGSQMDAADHKAVCQVVAEGLADAGATLSDERPAGETAVVDGCREAGYDPAKFKIVERTGVIPGDVIATRAALPAVVHAKVKDALLGMSKSEQGTAQLKAIFHADGFASVSDDDFAPVREVEMYLDLK